MNTKTTLKRHHLFYLLILSIAMSLAGRAAPYGSEGMEISHDQPDGSKLSLRVFGDEFYARTETFNGYTVIYVPEERSYFYAERGPDGASIVAGNTEAHLPTPAHLTKHLTEKPEVIREARMTGIEKYAGEREQRWLNRVQAVRKQRDIEAGILPAAPEGGPKSAASAQQEILAAPVNGEKIGLTILVQFPDDPLTAEVDPTNFPTSQSKIERYCNNVGYTENENTGSVRDYFSDMSQGALTYTQIVTQVVTLPKPRSYYNYSDYEDENGDFQEPSTLRNAGLAGRLIIADAIAELQADGFDFSGLSLGTSNRVVATNVFFAGSTSGVWAQGLWPHSWSMPFPGIDVGGSLVYRYQITNINSPSPSVGTFIHENGHLLLDLPDLYDYGGDSEGVGRHCIMGSGNFNNSGRTPAPLNAYFKDIVGWANVTDLTNVDVANVSLPTTGNIAYRIRKPDLTSEYFIVENRGAGDKWAAAVPDQGIAIWHIDEAKSGNDEQQMTPTQHYEVSLEQADGLFNLENDQGRGDAQDLFDSSDGSFNDETLPNADWWDGSASGIQIEVTSPVGPNMDVQFGDPFQSETIIIASPGGGESLFQGFTTNITWSSNVTGNVQIELYKGGLLQSVLASNEANDGTYPWTVSESAGVGSDYRIRISSLENPAIFDESDSDFQIMVFPTLENVLDGGGLSWTAVSEVAWFPQIVVSHDGIDAAENGDIADNENSDLQTTVTGPGTLSFWWQVSSEPNYDFLRFYIDGVEQGGDLAPISGVVNWEQKTVSIPAGTHILRWSYTKDVSVSSNLDSAWLDEVSFTASSKPEIAVEQPATFDLTDGSAIVDFGSVDLGENSGDLVFTIRNQGTDPLTGLSVTKDGIAAADYTVGGLGVTTLAPGASTTFTVNFVPSVFGTRSAAVHIASNDADESPFDIELTGEGLGIPEIVIEQPVSSELVDEVASVDFGEVNQSESSGEIVFTIRNSGTGLLTGLTITKDGENASDFLVGDLGVTNLAPGASTTFTVDFVAAGSGLRSAAIHIASNDADENPFDIEVTGTSLASYLEDFGANASQVEFSAVGWSIFILDDTGSLNDISDINAQPAWISPAGYAFTAPRRSSTYDNTPRGPGLMFTTEPASELGSPDLGDLTLMSVDVNADGSSSDPSLGRFAIQIGSQWFASEITTMSTTNAGPGGAYTTFETPVSFDFSDGNNWRVMTVDLGDGGGIDIADSPVGGILDGNVVAFGIYSENGNGGDHFRIDNFSVAASEGEPETGPEIVVEQPVETSLVDGVSTIDFGSLFPTESSGNVVFTIRNTGTVPLTGLAVLIDGAHAADFVVGNLGVTNLDPGESTTFDVSFLPGDTGIRSAGLHIASNDADENPFDLNLTGVGIGPPEIVVEQPVSNNLVDGIASVDFGNVAQGEASEPIVFTIRNTGASPLTDLSLLIDGPAAGEFSAGDLGSTTLAAGASTTFSMLFSPGSPGVRSAAIHISSNDADENPFDVALTGISVASYLEEFDNGGVQTSFSGMGWNVLILDDIGSLNDISNFNAQPAWITSTGYAFTAPRRSTAYDDTPRGPALMFTTEPTAILGATDVQDLTLLSVDVNSDGSSSDPSLGRFAIRIGTQWYASDLSILSTTNTGPGGAYPAFTTPVEFDFADGSNWRAMTVNMGAGGGITVAGASIGGILSGTVDAFGLYVENGNGGDHFRIDNYSVAAGGNSASAEPEMALRSVGQDSARVGQQITVEDWRFANFRISGDSGKAASIGDPDGDSINNLMEYAFNLDPSQADDYPIETGRTADSFYFIYPRNLAASDLSFTIEENSDLGSALVWSASRVSEEILETSHGVEMVKATRTLLPGEHRLFLRLKISLKE